MPESRRLVLFKSRAFNTTEDKSYFINSGCFGDDLAVWLIRELTNRSVTADREPGQEDFGWYFNFEVAGKEHTFVIAYRPDNEKDGTWIGCIERRRGLIGSLFGARNRGIDPTAAHTLHSILTASPQVQDVRWYFQQDFDKGHEELAAPAP